MKYITPAALSFALCLAFAPQALAAMAKLELSSNGHYMTSAIINGSIDSRHGGHRSLRRGPEL